MDATGIQYEEDPRHAEFIIKDRGVDKAKGVSNDSRVRFSICKSEASITFTGGTCRRRSV